MTEWRVVAWQYEWWKARWGVWWEVRGVSSSGTVNPARILNSPRWARSESAARRRAVKYMRRQEERRLAQPRPSTVVEWRMTYPHGSHGPGVWERR